MKKLPRRTVVTPSFNQARFLRDTIESVLGQNYPDLEYIVMDGGSTDGSVEIIKDYEKHLTFWSSERDKGQSDAINKGFARATGRIMAWLNSDDYYLPGTLRFVAETLDPDRAELVLGNCFHFQENKSEAKGSDVPRRHQAHRLSTIDYIIQPSTFWTRVAWDKAGPLNDNYHYVFDWDWYLRAMAADTEFKVTPRYLSAYRAHEAHKSGGIGDDKREREIRGMHERHGSPRLLKLYDDCRAHQRTISRVRKWAKSLKLTRVMGTTAILKLFLPGIFWGADEKDIKDILGLISEPTKANKH
jgi:glycosyltransferase involved in cell wall biosynthesis